MIFLRPWARLLGALLMVAGASPAVATDLRLLTWGDYLDPSVIDDFVRATGARIGITTFDTNEERTARLSDTGGRGYDVVLVSQLSVRSYARRKWIAAMPSSRPAALAGFAEEALADPGAYCQPYVWGTSGIAYRTDLVDEPPTSWRDLLIPARRVQGKILMAGDSRSMLDGALRALGTRLADATRDDLETAERLLVEQNQAVLSYQYPLVAPGSHLEHGTAALAWIYPADARKLRGLGVPLEFVYPSEGTELWMDHWCLSNHATNPDLAERFLELLADPDVAARNAQFLGFAPSHQAAVSRMQDVTRHDPLVFPPDDVLSRSNRRTALAPRTQKRVNEIGARVRQ